MQADDRAPPIPSISTIPPSNPTSPTVPPPNPLAAHPVYPLSSTELSPREGGQDAPERQSSTPSAAAAELSRAQMKLTEALRHFADFPIKGIDFVDIMPLFMDPSTHTLLNTSLDLQLRQSFHHTPDVVVGLDARGFLFGPALALRHGVGFAPVRKKGKLPGPCVTAAYEKEYGTDLFQMQQDAIQPGQNVLIVDDIIATGGSAKAAADLVAQLGGKVMGYLFILEIKGLNGRDKLGTSPSVILLEDA